MIFFFFNDTATTEIYTLSLHDALPISFLLVGLPRLELGHVVGNLRVLGDEDCQLRGQRSEEHTSELQSRLHLVCRLLLEKKKHGTIIIFLSSILTIDVDSLRPFAYITH